MYENTISIHNVLKKKKYIVKFSTRSILKKKSVKIILKQKNLKTKKRRRNHFWVKKTCKKKKWLLQ